MPKKSEATIGQRIKQIRESKGMRKHDLAVKLKVSDQLVNHYELQKDMKLSNIKKIAKALGVTVHDILCS